MLMAETAMLRWLAFDTATNQYVQDCFANSPSQVFWADVTRRRLVVYVVSNPHCACSCSFLPGCTVVLFYPSDSDDAQKNKPNNPSWGLAFWKPARRFSVALWFTVSVWSRRWKKMFTPEWVFLPNLPPLAEKKKRVWVCWWCDVVYCYS